MGDPKRLSGWLESRQESWRNIAARIKSGRRGRTSLTELNEVVHGYRSLARDLAVARQIAPDASITGQLERLYLQAHEFIHTRPGAGVKGLLRIFTAEGPAIVRRRFAPMLASTVLFLLAALAGWLLTFFYPETASLFASNTMISMVERGELWTDDLLNVTPSSIISFKIITNNVAVTFFAFALGIFYGVGTLYIIGLNGLMLGSIFAFTAGHSMAGRLFDFVVAHGVVELSVIALAGGLGIGLGEALVQPGNRTRSEAFQRVVSDAGKVLIVIVPYLIGAGVIEGFISPDPDFGRSIRVLVGVGYFAIMVTHLYFGGRGATRRL